MIFVHITLLLDSVFRLLIQVKSLLFEVWLGLLGIHYLCTSNIFYLRLCAFICGISRIALLSFCKTLCFKQKGAGKNTSTEAARLKLIFTKFACSGENAIPVCTVTKSTGENNSVYNLYRFAAYTYQ